MVFVVGGVWEGVQGTISHLTTMMLSRVCFEVIVEELVNISINLYS